VREELAYVRGKWISASEVQEALEEAGWDPKKIDPSDDRGTDAVRAKR